MKTFFYISFLLLAFSFSCLNKNKKTEEAKGIELSLKAIVDSIPRQSLLINQDEKGVWIRELACDEEIPTLSIDHDTISIIWGDGKYDI